MTDASKPTPEEEATGSAYITGGIFAAIGLLFLIRPQLVAKSFESEMTPIMLAQVRAFYGGAELGLGVALIVLGRRGLHEAVVLTAAIVLGCLGTARLLAITIDQFDPVLAVITGFEFFGCIMNSRIARRFAAARSAESS